MLPCSCCTRSPPRTAAPPEWRPTWFLELDSWAAGSFCGRFNVRGLNTAATLWCSAAVGVLAASGHLVFTLIGTGTIVAVHLLGRPLGRLVDRDNAVEDEGLQPYQVRVICRPKAETYVRAHIVQRTSSNDITLRGIRTGPAGDDNITLTAHLLMVGHTPAKLERLVAELSLQPGVYAVHWYAGEHAQAE